MCGNRKGGSWTRAGFLRFGDAKQVKFFSSSLLPMRIRWRVQDKYKKVARVHGFIILTCLYAYDDVASPSLWLRRWKIGALILLCALGGGK